MAVAFNGSSQYLSMSHIYTEGEPLSLVGWFRSNSATVGQCVIGMGNNGSSGYYQLKIAGEVAGDPVAAQKQADSGAAAIANTSAGYATSVWQHGVATFTSDTLRGAHIDGGSSGTNTESKADPTPDFISIGVMRRSGFINYFAGALAEVALYRAELSTSSIAVLAAGYAPMAVQPSDLYEYWPLRHANELRGMILGLTLTATGSPTTYAHPRIIYPQSARIYSFPSAGAASTVPPLYHQRQQQGMAS